MRKIFVPLVVVAAAMFAYAPVAIARLPYESTMLLVQKIFYFHFATWMALTAGLIVCAIGSAMYLFGNSAAGDRYAFAAAELVLQSGPLVGTKTADTPRLRDAKPLHDLLGANLTHAGHGLKQRRDLHLAYDVIGLTVLENLGQRRRGVLEPVLDLSTLLAGLGGLLESSGPLVGGQWRKSHAWSPRVSYRKTLFARGN